MEARILRAAVLRTATPVIVSVCLLFVALSSARAAGYRTANFTVDAPTPRLAKEIGDAAEHYRQALAQEWLGKQLPDWSRPCPIKARVAPNLGAGGATSFVFDRGEVFGWQMDIQGSRERVLDSVVPHEVTHTIFASHFRQPIPRWADEGACTTVEHRSEIAKQEHMLIEFLQTRRGIPFSNMFAMKEYPSDVLPLYAQGHSLSRFLIDQRGKREFIAFLEDGLTDENWIRAVRDRYGYPDLLTLQNSWQNWIVQGRPPLQLAADVQVAAAQTANDRTDGVLVASHEASTPAPVRPASRAVIRGQDPGAAAPTPVTPTPATRARLAAAGINGPLASRPRSTATPPQPWTPANTARLTTPNASVYDARATGVVRK